MEAASSGGIGGGNTASSGIGGQSKQGLACSIRSVQRPELWEREFSCIQLLHASIHVVCATNCIRRIFPLCQVVGMRARHMDAEKIPWSHLMGKCG